MTDAMATWMAHWPLQEKLGLGLIVVMLLVLVIYAVLLVRASVWPEDPFGKTTRWPDEDSRHDD